MNPTIEQRIKENRFCGWMKTDRFPNSSGDKVRVRRKDGTKGFSTIKFDYYPEGVDTQFYWEDSDGTKHNFDYYAEWAFLKKHGGLVL